MGFIKNSIAERLGGNEFDTRHKGYKFLKIKQQKAKVRAAHPDIPIIDLGIGEPDLPADPLIVKTLWEEAGKASNRWYADNGIYDFQGAAAEYLAEQYNVDGLDPAKEIMHGIGAKTILAMLPMCFINPGDILLTTVPGYPIMSNHTKYLGGEVFPLSLHMENNFYPDFSIIPEDILQRAKLLYLNYPNNPTGQVATKEFYEEVIDFAQRNQIIVVCDASYGPITFDGVKPISFLSIKGAKEVGVELHSLSKAFNMTGWRLGFIAGNAKIIEVYGNVKANCDSGQFIAIQKAGIRALQHIEITKENCKRYSRRHDLLVDMLRQIGFQASKPKGTFYCYVPIPKGTKSGIRFKNAEEASEYLIQHALVSTVPWDDAGAFLRFSVTYEAKDEEEEKKIMDELKDRLSSLGLVF
ncbi:MAG: LL-diaminopimelate aminotransferase [Bacillota bacterium]